MIITDLGAAYAPQTTYSKSTLSYRLPLAPKAPIVPMPALPSSSMGPGDAFSRQPAPVRPPITTPESADVMQPAKNYSLPNYGYAQPQVAPNPYGAPKPTVVDYYPGYGPGATATEPTVEMPQGDVPAGSMEASLEAQAAAALPWYKRPLPLVGLTVGGGLAIVGAILLLRK